MVALGDTNLVVACEFNKIIVALESDSRLSDVNISLSLSHFNSEEFAGPKNMSAVSCGANRSTSAKRNTIKRFSFAQTVLFPLQQQDDDKSPSDQHSSST